MKFRPPHLVQRIHRPLYNALADGPFTNAGLSKNANEILGSFLSFDYMGSSEFEWGTVPKCLQAMVNIHKKFVAVAGTCNVAAPKLFGRDEAAAKKLGWKEPMPALDVPFWLLTHKAIQTEMFVWICDVQAKEEYPRPSLKEYNGFMPSAYVNTWLKGRQCEELERKTRTVGWLDLDNLAFWTIEPKMFGHMCQLFGVQQSTKAA